MSQSVSSLCVGKGLFESLRSKSCSRSLSNSNATNFYRFVSMFGLLNVKSLVGNFADNYPNFATNRQYPSKDVLDAFANQHHFCRPIEYDLHFRWGFSEYVFFSAPLPGAGDSEAVFQCTEAALLSEGMLTVIAMTPFSPCATTTLELQLPALQPAVQPFLLPVVFFARRWR